MAGERQGELVCDRDSVYLPCSPCGMCFPLLHVPRVAVASRRTVGVAAAASVDAAVVAATASAGAAARVAAAADSDSAP